MKKLFVRGNIFSSEQPYFISNLIELHQIIFKDNEALRYSVSYTWADNRVCNSNTDTAHKVRLSFQLLPSGLHTVLSWFISRPLERLNLCPSVTISLIRSTIRSLV